MEYKEKDYFVRVKVDEVETERTIIVQAVNEHQALSKVQEFLGCLSNLDYSVVNCSCK